MDRSIESILKNGLDQKPLPGTNNEGTPVKHNNLIITGPTGVGKSYLACAFTQKACREGLSALYLRTTKLFEDLNLAKGDGRYLKLLTSYDRDRPAGT